MGLCDSEQAITRNRLTHALEGRCLGSLHTHKHTGHIYKTQAEIEHITGDKFLVGAELFSALLPSALCFLSFLSALG